MLMTGLRGVGKTVLLNEIERTTDELGFHAILIEVKEEQPIAMLLVPQLRQLLYELDRVKGAGNLARRALGVLRSFVGGLRVKVGDVDFGIDIEPEKGAADSGDLSTDLTNLLVAVGDAAKERSTVIVLLLDEIQYLDEHEFSALIRAMHRLQQRQLPFALVGAGLPTVPGLAGDAKSYAERLFDYPDIGPLDREDAFTALREPTAQLGVVFESGALEEVFLHTKGYPYFLQEWGYQSWNTAQGPKVTRDTVLEATSAIMRRLDTNFFRVRYDRLTNSGKRTLRAMAELGPGPHRVSDVAATLGYKASSSLSPVRKSLIRKGMIYSPSHGDLTFTVPLFDQFMKRAMPEFP